VWETQRDDSPKVALAVAAPRERAYGDMMRAGIAAVLCLCLLTLAMQARSRAGHTALYGGDGDGWWDNTAHDSYDDQLSRGGRQSWVQFKCVIV